MSARTVFMFSGQGSHYYQMGRALYESSETFRGWMRRLDDVARRETGVSVVETVYSSAHAKGDPFVRTLLTHPAIFMVEYSLAQTLSEAGVRPDTVLGTSLGSFAAAAVAGFLDVEDALHLVIRQAMALEKSCEPGGMTAVLADPTLFGEDFLGARSELAAVNFSGHFVVSAKRAELEQLEAGLTVRGIGYQRLPVSFAFHSQWIDRARESFFSFVRSVPRRTGRLALACCDSASVVTDLPETYFWDVVRHPIQFREMIARLERDGARRYIDVGPAGTLSTFLKYLLPASSASTVQTVLTPFGGDRRNLDAVLASVGH